MLNIILAQKYMSIIKTFPSLFFWQKNCTIDWLEVHKRGFIYEITYAGADCPWSWFKT